MAYPLKARRSITSCASPVWSDWSASAPTSTASLLMSCSRTGLHPAVRPVRSSRRRISRGDIYRLTAPLGAADLAAWSGLRKTIVRKAWKQIEDDLIEVRSGTSHTGCSSPNAPGWNRHLRQAGRPSAARVRSLSSRLSHARTRRSCSIRQACPSGRRPPAPRNARGRRRQSDLENPTTTGAPDRHGRAIRKAQRRDRARAGCRIQGPRTVPRNPNRAETGQSKLNPARSIQVARFSSSTARSAPQ